MRNVNYNPINAAPIASNNSAAIDCDQMYAASFIATFSVNDGAGALKVQASNEFPLNNQASGYVPSAASWIDVPSATVTVASGATSLVPMPLSFSYRWLRLVWTRTGGMGTITVSANIQGF